MDRGGGRRRTRKHRDYGQVALIAQIGRRHAARRRRVRALHARRPGGAAAGGRSLRAGMDHDARRRRRRASHWSDDAFLAELRVISARGKERLHEVARPQDVSARARIRAAGDGSTVRADRQRGTVAAPHRRAGLQPRPARRVRARARDQYRVAAKRSAITRCLRATRRGAASIAMRASPSRTDSRSIFALDRAIFAGRAGLRSRCSTRCRLRSAHSRARCCSACPERAFARGRSAVVAASAVRIVDVAAGQRRKVGIIRRPFHRRGLFLQSDASLPSMRIGPHSLPNNLAVAPMAGVTDRPFRQLCKRLGAGFAVSEMVASNPRLWGTEKTRRRIDHAGEVAPIAVQIAGADPRDDGRRGALQRRPRRADHRHQHGLSGEEGVQRRRGLGAARRRAAGGAHRRRGRARGRRAGDAQDPHRLAIRARATRVAIARIAEDAGIAALTVHGRTRACGSSARPNTTPSPP